MSTKTTTTVSLRGDRNYVKALRVLAAQNDATVGVFIRNLIDDKHGAEIQSITSSFFDVDTDRMEVSANAYQALIDGNN